MYEDVVCKMSCFFISSTYLSNTATSSCSAAIGRHVAEPTISHFYFRSICNFQIWTIHQCRSSESFHESVDPTPTVRLSTKDNWRTSRNRDEGKSFWKKKEQIEGLFPPLSPSYPPDPETFSNRPSDSILLKYFNLSFKGDFCEHNMDLDRNPTLTIIKLHHFSAKFYKLLQPMIAGHVIKFRILR